MAAPDALERLDHVRRWLREEVEYRPYFIRVFVPGAGRRLVSLRAYRYVGSQETAAPYVVQLSYSAVDLVFPFPAASLVAPDLLTIPFPGLSPYPPHVPVATRLEVVGDGLTDMEASVIVRYEGRREIAETQLVSERSPLHPREVRATDLPPSFWEADAVGPVTLLILGRKGDVLLSADAQMRLQKSEDDLVCIEVADDVAGWSVRIPLRPQGGRTDFTVSTEGRASLAASIKAFRFRYAVHRGSVVEARNVHDHAPVFHSDYSVDPCNATDLDGLARLYDRLASIEQAFPGRLVMPERLDPDDVRTIEFVSSAIELGEFIDAPRESYEVPMTRLSVEYLEREFVGERTPEGLEAPVHGCVQLFGDDLDLGPWHVCLERPRLRTPVAELIERLRQEPEAGIVWVPFAADRCILQFERYAKG